MKSAKPIMFFVCMLTAIAMALAFTIQPALAGRPAVCHRANISPDWSAVCAAEFAALGIGAAVWETRRKQDVWCKDQFAKGVDLNKKIGGNTHPCKNVMSYCFHYSFDYLHYQWNSECFAYDNHLLK